MGTAPEYWVCHQNALATSLHLSLPVVNARGGRLV
jgi:hypothetical protein